MILSAINTKSIRVKLLLYFLVLILLPISTLGVLGTIIYSRFIEEQVNTHTLQMINQVNKNVEFYVKDMEDIIKYLSREPLAIRFLREGNFSKNEDNQTESELKRILKAFADIHPEIAGIMVVNKHGIYTSNEMRAISRDSLANEAWYRQSAQEPESIQLFSKPIGRNIQAKSNYSADNVVSITKAVFDPDTGNHLGVILIDMKLDVIQKTIEDITLGKNGFLFIMDPNGEIVYAPVNPVVYRVKGEWLQNSYSKSLIQEIKGSMYQILYEDSSYTKWKFVGVFSLNETLKIVTETRYYLFIIGMLTLVLAVIAALFFTASIDKPLRKLRSLMKRAEEGDLNVCFHSKYNDEIGQLGNSFNKMIEEIRKLINLVYSEQRSKREAELKILQAQIKPHFLYNTLDTIQWMAQSRGAHDIVSIVSALTNLFRIGLSKGKEMITIREELEHVRSYLIIQKARYEEKLEFEISYEEDILDYCVLKLILQPLVENAIYHGIKARRGTGKVAIDVRKRDGKLCLTVSDNGVGIAPEKLTQINEILSGKKSSEGSVGYGIFNVDERIKLSFEDDCGLSFDSVYGQGTTVEIWHPLIER